MRKSTKHIAITAAGSILFAAAPAQAQSTQRVVVTSAQEVLTAKVSFADLNLSSVAGRDRLDARVRAAVKQVCPGSANVPLVEMPRLQKCRQAARSDAASQIERIIAAKG